ncbi:MAG: bifunctional DNA-formamidopyrimidine glycosylase/DNA-(apurinic or apyrimidinic site) lyase [Actinobacteria bacterium]|nr:bifunctional DNA-formamidopyrimidine glycosylase/DNA-(apurinic or apyrimidinic site) lyase [Actinomycetota bacterium]
MPELPEVETIRRELDAAIVGRRITAVTIVDAKLILGKGAQAFGAALRGARVADTDRRGKLLILATDRGTLVLHLMMTGRISLRHSPAVRPHTRLVLEFDQGPSLHFVDTRRFGRAWMTDQAGLAALTRRMGPEPLDSAFTAARLAAGLRGRAVAIKPALLDQRAVAGVGNIYADEALWLARIHPATPAGSLGRHKVEALARAIVTVLRDGVAHGGTSFRTYENSRGEQGAHQRWLKVFRRTGEPCFRCGRPIERTIVGQRSTHSCPRCQRVYVRP